MNMIELNKMLSSDNATRYRSAYYEIMYDNYHYKLFDYLDYIKENEIIKNITISKNDIVMEFDMCGISIKLLCEYRNPLSLPLYIFDSGSYEDNENKIIMECVQDNDIVLDIGANVGLYTILLNKYKNCSTYSFEPIKYTFDLLNKNLKINNLNTKIYNIGLSNENKVENFYFNYKEIAASSMRDLREDKDNTEIVQCNIRKLDDFVAEEGISNIDFIKIDVEGAELFALRGGAKSINKYKPIIFCEMLRKWAKKFDYHPNDIIDLLKNMGYSCYAINENTLGLISQVTNDTMETNFLFLDTNKERHKRIAEKLTEKMRIYKKTM